MATQQMKQKHSHKLPIQDNLVGLVIGRGGSTINQIREVTGCNVQIRKPNHEFSSQWVLITGEETQVKDAVQYINKIIDRNQSDGNSFRRSRGGGRGGGRGGRSQPFHRDTPTPEKPKEYQFESQEFPNLPSKPTTLGGIPSTCMALPVTCNTSSNTCSDTGVKSYAHIATPIEIPTFTEEPEPKPRMVVLGKIKKKAPPANVE